MNIYVVMGTTGEYSDRSEWPVVAFHTEKAANKRVKELADWAITKGVHTSQGGGDFNTRARVSKDCPGAGGEYFRIDYTGIDWYVMPVRLADTSTEGQK